MNKALLTLITDKIINHGLMIGAHRNENWLTNYCYDDSNVKKMQGTLDRIGKVVYFKSPHVDEKNWTWENSCYLGDDLYDHSIRCYWRELFGHGDDERITDCQLQDKVGKWHMKCDEGIWITLWHPTKQEFQEKIYDCWDLKDQPHWRPIYNYTKDEVVDALKIIAKTFNWKFEDGGETSTIITR